MLKKSVLMVVDKYPATYGHTTVINNLCVELRRLGVKVAIGAFSFDEKPPDNIEYIKLNRLKLLLSGIDSLEFDIIHSHQTLPNYFLFSRRSSKIKILHYHGASNMLQRINFKIFMKLYRNCFTKIISVSNAGISQMKDMIGHVNATVLYNGVTDEFFTEEITTHKKGTPQLLFVSALRKYKQTSVLVNLMPKLLEVFPDAHLQIVGDGECLEKLKNQIKIKKLETHVELTGKLNTNELRKRYSSCDLYISASNFEVCPVPTLEAMACGKPLVLYNIEPHKEIISISKAGEIFSSLESPEIISKIKNVYNNRKELGLNGKKFAKQNTWSEVCKKLIGIYEDEVD